MICLTFDTDWMTDSALQRFLQEFPIPGTATFFLHDMLPSLFATAHELCPHPAINDLNGWRPALESIAGRLPTRPVGVRPHSCVFSHSLGVAFHDLGYRYVSQAANLYQVGLAPIPHPWGIWEMPIYYMDNMDFWFVKNWPDLRHEPFHQRVIEAALDSDGLYVFDFHPLHIALNTRNHLDYGSVKDKIITEGVSPFDLTFPGRGVRTFFLELCAAMQQGGHRSVSCYSALNQLGHT